MTSYNKHEAKEHAREYAHGVWGAMHTPFTADGELDEQGLVDVYIYLADEMKLNGVTWAAVMGEFWAMSVEGASAPTKSSSRRRGIATARRSPIPGTTA